MKTKDKPKLKTLAEFVEECGSQEKAAHVIGVAFATVNKWVNGHTEPKHPLIIRRLAELGVAAPSL